MDIITFQQQGFNLLIVYMNKVTKQNCSKKKKCRQNIDFYVKKL